MLGVTIGLVSGYYSGWADTVLLRTMDTLLVFPAVLLAILAVGVVYTPTFARLTRASALSIREKEYMEAARAIGVRDA